MRTVLNPKHFSKIGNSYILWFEASNQYIVISDALMDILDVYLASTTQEAFIKQLHRSSDIPLPLAEDYYNEITDLLISSNSFTLSHPQKTGVPLHPKKNIEMIYGFGDKTIAIHFGSDQIKDLIHPQWAHAIGHQTDPVTCTFQIFKSKDTLFILKNKTYVGHYSVSDYHLLQGQFAVELINVLYAKQESDWIATFHASTVCDDKEAIMIIGDSGNGKSTLSAVLMANGMDVLADDFTPLSATDSTVYRFPSGVSVKEGAFKALGKLFPDFEVFPTHASTSKHVKIKYIPPIKSFETAISHFPCKKIVYVKYDALGKSEFEKVDTIQILPTLITESWLSPLASNAQLFLDWLQDLECYELNYSDNSFAISQI